MKTRENLIQELKSKSCFTEKQLQKESTENLKILKKFIIH